MRRWAVSKIGGDRGHPRTLRPIGVSARKSRILQGKWLNRPYRLPLISSLQLVAFGWTYI